MRSASDGEGEEDTASQRTIADRPVTGVCARCATVHELAQGAARADATFGPGAEGTVLARPGARRWPCETHSCLPYGSRALRSSSPAPRRRWCYPFRAAARRAVQPATTHRRTRRKTRRETRRATPRT